MIKEMKSPICCGDLMDLKAVCITPEMNYDRLFFQCKKCGKIDATNY